MTDQLNRGHPTPSLNLSKKCTKCGVWYPATVDYFTKNNQKKDGLSPRCKKCLNEQAGVYRQNNRRKIREREKGYYKKNSTKVCAKSREYWNANKQACLQKSKEYREKNKEQIKMKKKKYYLEHKKERSEYFRKYQQDRLENDSYFHLKYLLRRRVLHALKGQIKSGATFDLIGCSIPDLKRHLEKQFKHGMSWENYGEWHIDHIRPCASFDLSDPEQQRQCFNFKNLQPLWAIENLTKGAKWDNSL